MAEDELVAFRKRWEEELKLKKEQQIVCVDSPFRDVPGPSGQRKLKNRYFEGSEQSPYSASKPLHPEEGGCVENDGRAGEGGEALAESEDQPEYVTIARGLLDGRTGPLLDRIEKERTRRKRQYHNVTSACSTILQLEHPQRKVIKNEKLVDQFIQDLNEVNDIPFFDIDLPYELALKIFQYLSCAELGRCAQVSRTWKVLAEDDVLWFKMCTRQGFHQDANVSDSPCWKSTLRDYRNAAKVVRSNWKTRVGSISHLQFELGKVLCDVSSCDKFVLAGYTSGDVRLWDTLHWDSAASYLKSNDLSANSDPRPYVSHVQVNNTVAAAAYEDGCVDLWSTETGGEPIHHYQSSGRIQALALSPDSPVLASITGSNIRLDHADDRGYWRTLCQTQLPKIVESFVLVPGRGQQCPLAALRVEETVYLLNPQEEEPQTLHSVYGQPVTCLDASNSHVALGVKHTGWAMHDGGNKIHVYNLETGKPVVCVGSSLGDFTCINLRDAPPNLLVCGNKDRRCLLPTVLNKARNSLSVFPSSDNRNIYLQVHTCHNANLAHQMRKGFIKEPFSFILHLLAAAAAHKLAGKQKSLARLWPDLPPLFLFSTKSIWLLSSWLNAKDRPYSYCLGSVFCLVLLLVMTVCESITECCTKEEKSWMKTSVVKTIISILQSRKHVTFLAVEEYFNSRLLFWLSDRCVDLLEDNSHSSLALPLWPQLMRFTVEDKWKSGD